MRHYKDGVIYDVQHYGGQLTEFRQALQMMSHCRIFLRRVYSRKRTNCKSFAKTKLRYIAKHYHLLSDRGRGIPMEQSDAVLREGGYKLTPQRYMILRVIQEAEAHLSIEEIIQRVQERNPYVNQSTVYRTLDLLQDLGLVRATHLAGKHTRFEMVGGQAHNHLVF